MSSIKQAVQQAVTEIYKEQGEVRPSILVETATPKSSPIHDAFEWDDKVAGREFRLEQARHWIRTVTIVVDEDAERLIHVPALKIDNQESAEGYYKPASVVVKNQDEFERARTQLLWQLNSMKESYEYLKKIAEEHVQQKGRKLNPKVNFRKADGAFKQLQSALS